MSYETQTLLGNPEIGNMSSDHTETWPLFVCSDKCDEQSRTEPIVSAQVYKALEITLSLFLSGISGILGVVTNAITIIVFKRQGFQDSINISLLGLAIADMCCVTTMVWAWSCYFIILSKPSNFLFSPVSLLMMTANFPRLIATRLTCWMTALISVERCLCVTIPFKVKFIFTPKNTSIITIGIFLTVLPLYGFQMYRSRSFVWLFNPILNETRYYMKVEEDDTQALVLLRTLCYTLLPLINLFIVIMCAVVMVIKLKLSTQWRMDAGSACTHDEARTKAYPYIAKAKQEQIMTGEEPGKYQNKVTKEQKLTKMILTITILFIICNTPSNMLQTAGLFIPEFSNNGDYKSLFHITNMVAFFMETVNSSVNLFVYYSMSTKFKAQVLQMFKFLPKAKSDKE